MFDSLAQTELLTMERYHFPESHREIYKTIGGACSIWIKIILFLEKWFKGMDIVDSIARVKTDPQDKPINDVKIIKAKMIKRKSYK